MNSDPTITPTTQTPNQPDLTDPLSDLKSKLAPLTQSSTGLLHQFTTFWHQHRLKIIIAFFAIVLLSLLFSAIYIGSNLGRQASRNGINPPPLPEATPTPTKSYQSVIDPLYQQFKDYSILLPDPAPPAVDYQITLEQQPNF